MSMLSSFLAFSVFTVLLFAKVDSWGARIVLAGIVAGVYFFLGSLFAMIAAVVLSIGMLIQSQLPTTSGM
jgi:hypothetical protein